MRAALVPTKTNIMRILQREGSIRFGDEFSLCHFVKPPGGRAPFSRSDSYLGVSS